MQRSGEFGGAGAGGGHHDVEAVEALGDLPGEVVCGWGRRHAPGAEQESGLPSIASRAARWAEAAGWVMPSRAAARVSEPAR